MDERTMGGESLPLKTALPVPLPTPAQLSTSYSQQLATEKSAGIPQPPAGAAHRALIDVQGERRSERTLFNRDTASWIEHVSEYVCVTNAMCCKCELQIRIKSCCPGVGVDVLTVTLSHAGLWAPRKVLSAFLKMQEFSLNHINLKIFQKCNCKLKQ